MWNQNLKMFEKNNATKKGKYNMSIHGSMSNTGGIFQTNNKLFVTVNRQNSCKLEFDHHLWIPFLNKPQSDIKFFAIIYFHMDKILMKKWEHEIGPNDFVTFNE